MSLKLVVHAPTVPALTRARRNVRNLLAADPEVQVELVVNGEAARAALAEPDPDTDPLLRLCENSLRNAGIEDTAGNATVRAAIHHIALRQAEGWGYFRA